MNGCNNVAFTEGNEMKQILMMIGVCVMLSGCIGAGDNSPLKAQSKGTFPQMTGIDLQGNEQSLPQAFRGKYNIVAIGFEREHQTPINTWMPAIDELTKDENITFYEVPVIYEMTAAGRFWVNNGMRSGIESEQARNHTITVYTDRDRFLSLMDMEMDANYTLLLDASGKILWRAKGRATDALIEELRAAVK